MIFTAEPVCLSQRVIPHFLEIGDLYWNCIKFSFGGIICNFSSFIRSCINAIVWHSPIWFRKGGTSTSFEGFARISIKDVQCF